ncbi:hypothetical protein HW450_05305 [Corynebacterium hindlerae]|uniref:Fibrinogen C-terminal domain-containing protein n=1 Tax=Corynebacterium hindlerae TaxID=699041 RepID=A0A7G5FHP2_9CORY|nr:fibrinogen-like YCDxxxxGGGW domain-containing protein [Corynebacterium hindlerae]QMV86133.1 hypothetical protein HW450_05305 [Corynebacterium hindlerae]
MQRLRRVSALVAGILLSVTSLGVPPVAQSADVVAGSVVRDGTTSATAAASCWEIKQQAPQSKDGVYWLYTPQMSAPAQFFCDQTSAGGGWVLIGKGREGWDRYPDGQRTPADLLTRNRTPEDFPVAQLAAEKIDGLLAGTAVNQLPEGIRIVRSADSAGTQFRAMNLIPERMTTWSWSLASDHAPLFRYEDFGQWFKAASMDERFGIDSMWRSLDLTESNQREYQLGFAYGPFAWGGSKDPGDFLWSATGNMPVPYTEVYIRPRVSASDPRFERIADSGLDSSHQRPIASNFASPTTWGVTGNLNGRTTEGNAPVQAFAEIGDTMFVAGNFTQAEERRSSTVMPRTGIAAFDKTTGELRPEFNVTLDNQAKALVAMPNGKLLIGGDFRTANGQPHSGTVLVDPATGAIDETWNLQIINRLSGGMVSVKSLALGGDKIYVGGNFTHFTTGHNHFVYGRAAGRVNLNGTPDRSWNPEFNGTVLDIDTDESASTVYVAGYFTTSGKTTVKKAAAISAAPGAAVDSKLNFQGSFFHEPQTYQQAVDHSGGLVFFGGAQHALFGYDPETLQRVSGSVTKTRGGDFQAIASDGSVTYAGCHCSQNTYENAYSWPTLSNEWTRSDNIQWFGAWDAATGKQLGQFSPYKLKSKNAGAWALFVASDGAVWAGGDFTGSFTTLNSSQWNGGFVRFPAKDVQPPAAPTQLSTSGTTADSVNLSWEPVADAENYQVLRDDRVIATVNAPRARVPHGGENRFFVRAVDKAGNFSMTTPVAHAPSPQEAENNPSVLIGAGESWQYSYNQGPVEAGWNLPAADRSSWAEGVAPLGYGGKLLTTQITPPANGRPITTWFAKDFEVTDPKSFTTATLEVVADDGAVVYLNGREVSRIRMGSGAVTPDTRANGAVPLGAAHAERHSLSIPSSWLSAGTNTIGVETHLNYRGSASMSFDGSLHISDFTPAVDSPTQPDLPTLTNEEELIGAGSQWQYWSQDEEPETHWHTAGQLTDWQQGSAPLGWGETSLATSIELTGTKRPITTYFAHDLRIDKETLPADAVIEFRVRADDGALVRVNGMEVGRLRLDDGEINHFTYANRAVHTETAAAEPLVIQIPVASLHDGANRIGVETHVNYRATPNVTFDMTAKVIKP